METPRESDHKGETRPIGEPPQILSYYHREAPKGNLDVAVKLFALFLMWVAIFGAAPFAFGWWYQDRHPIEDLVFPIMGAEAAVMGAVFMIPCSLFRQRRENPFGILPRRIAVFACVYIAGLFAAACMVYLLNSELAFWMFVLWGPSYPCVLPWIALKKEPAPNPGSHRHL